VPDAIRLDFDPTIAPFGLTVRLETLALAGVIFAVLVLVAIGAGRMRTKLSADPGAPGKDAGRLRRDDLILIAFGAVPGAVVGGRLDYGLLHLDYFGADVSRLTDPAQGGLALSLAVVLGAVTALAVARLLTAPIASWLHVASGPLLVGLGLGKLTMVLGGDGQGQFSDASWATLYVRPGPWQSANASAAAVPSQALEGILVLVAAVLILAVPVALRLRLRRWRRVVRPGLDLRREWWLLTGYRRFLTALCLWCVARFAAAFTWRDAQVAGSLRAEQLVLLVVFTGCAVTIVSAGLLERREKRAAARVSALAAKVRIGADLPEPRTGSGAVPR
jgi:prolipoprotein diacylglyceryltransferase